MLGLRPSIQHVDLRWTLDHRAKPGDDVVFSSPRLASQPTLWTMRAQANRHARLDRASRATRQRWRWRRILNAEWISVRGAGPCMLGPERCHRLGFVEPDIGIELSGQARFGIMAPEFALRPVDHADEPL